MLINHNGQPQKPSLLDLKLVKDIEENEDLMHARVQLAKACAAVLANGLKILGIDAPDRM